MQRWTSLLQAGRLVPSSFFVAIGVAFLNEGTSTVSRRKPKGSSHRSASSRPVTSVARASASLTGQTGLDLTRLAKGTSPPLAFRVAMPLLVAWAAFYTFWPALDAGFVNWDDDKVVVDNPHIRGLDDANLDWMFTRFKMGHYQPLTWMSYALDHAVSQYRYASASAVVKARYERGLDPKIFHLSNLLLHAGVAVGFYFLAQMLLRLVLPPPPLSPPGKVDWAIPLTAALAAVLFACHPLRVETVAWVTERRDVLSAFFLLPCLLFYLRYTLSQTLPVRIAYYVAAIVLLLLSLLSKAWGITLPAVMLVLDVYPLRRLGGRTGWTTRRAMIAYLDKIPFAALAVFFAYQAKQAQGTALDTMKSWDEWGVADRFSQFFYGLFFYAEKTFIPAKLIPLVQILPDNNPWAPRYLIAICVVTFAAVTLMACRKRWPGGIVLAVCYVGILSPVLGIAQSGPQLVADRYSYLGCLTWALLGGAGVLWLWRKRDALPWARKLLPVAGAGGVALATGFGVLTWRQTQVWHDSYALWSHTVKVDPRCVLARTNLGMLERQAGNVEAAIAHYQAAREVRPDDYILLNNLAVAIRTDPTRIDESIAVSREAVALQPKHPDLHFSLASALQQAGRIDEAIEQFNICVRLRGKPKYHRALGRIYMKQRRLESARVQYESALKLERKLDPRGRGAINALDRLGWIALRQERLDDAANRFQSILDLDPGNVGAQKGLQQVSRIRERDW